MKSKGIDGGLEINVEKLKNEDVVLAIFPLHDPAEVDYLAKNWFPDILKGKLYQPIDRIKDYFGAKIAFYFAFLEYFNVSLIAPAVVGIVVQIIIQATENVNHPVLPFYTVFILIWTELFVHGWSLKQEQLAFRWGLSDFEIEARDSVNFTG